MSDSHVFDDAPLPPPPVQPPRPKPARKNRIATTWLFGMGVLGVILACCAFGVALSFSKDNRSSDSSVGSIATATYKLVTLTPWPSGVPTWTATPEPTLSPTPGLGQVAEEGGYTLAASQVAFDPLAKRAPKAGQRLVAIEVTISNQSRSMTWVRLRDFVMFVSADYVVEHPETGLVDGELPEKTLYPGSQLTGWLVFEISAGLDVLDLDWNVAGTSTTLQVGLKP